MTQRTRTHALEYHYDADADVHEFIFRHASPQAVDMFVEQIGAVYARMTPESVVRLLVDYRPKGMPPITYLFSRTARWSGGLGFHPQARAAFLMKPDVLISLVERFTQSMKWGHLTTRTFTSDDSRADAMAWLTEGVS